MSVIHLPKLLFILRICVSLLGSFTSDAAASEACLTQQLQSRLGATDAHFAEPPLISRHENIVLTAKVTDVSRLKKSVQILNIHDARNKTKLSGLPDGTYVYTIDSAGHLAMANRLMDPGAARMSESSATFLASHAGLAILLENVFKTQPKLLAAGEIVVRSGKVRVVSNGAGTYRGVTANLSYAVGHFRSMGLAMDAQTELRDFSVHQYPDPHGEIEAQVREALLLIHDPHQKKVLDYTRQVMRQVDPNYKDSTSIRATILNPATSSEDKTLLFQGVQFMSSWRQLQDDEGYIVRHYLKAMGEEKYLRLLKKLSEAVPAQSK